MKIVDQIYLLSPLQKKPCKNPKKKWKRHSKQGRVADKSKIIKYGEFSLVENTFLPDYVKGEFGACLKSLVVQEKLRITFYKKRFFDFF